MARKLLLGALIIAGGVAAVAVHDQIPFQKRMQEAQDQVMDMKGAVNPFSVMPLRTVAGNYLAARFAVANDDLQSANEFYNRALAVAITPETEQFLDERALPAAIGSGDMKGALQITRKMDLQQSSATAQLAVLLQIIDGFKQNDVAQINKLLPMLRNDGFGRLLKPLLEAWAQVGSQKPEQAIATLQQLAKDYPSLKPLTQMHLAFIYDLQGNKQQAETYYQIAKGDHLSVRSAYLIGEFYEHQGKKDQAVKLYKELGTQISGSPLPDIVLARLNKGQLHDTNFIQKPSDGVAAALYDVATVLYQENSSRLAILYAQMAHYLAPKDEFTTLLLGDILAATEVSSQAEEYFTSVESDSDLYVLAQMRLAQLYEQQDKYPQAINILENLQRNPQAERQALMELGDLYRRKEDFAKAIPYYSRLLDGKKLVESDWVILYARGICYERSNEWDKAEADLLQALKLSPQQPEVLNYLAYSWADHGKNLPKSLEMLQKALAGAPDDPYIADSVGWALYKIGHIDQATPYLEAAIQSLPDDPVINSHLGDIYWAAGRHLEAQFQWERALKNAKKTDVELIGDLQQRLANGLPSANAGKNESDHTVSGK